MFTITRVFVWLRRENAGTARCVPSAATLTGLPHAVFPQRAPPARARSARSHTRPREDIYSVRVVWVKENGYLGVICNRKRSTFLTWTF